MTEVMHFIFAAAWRIAWLLWRALCLVLALIVWVIRAVSCQDYREDQAIIAYQDDGDPTIYF